MQSFKPVRTATATRAKGVSVIRFEIQSNKGKGHLLNMMRVALNLIPAPAPKAKKANGVSGVVWEDDTVIHWELK